MRLLVKGNSFYTVERATEISEKMQNDYPNWDWIVVDCGNNNGRIDVYDHGEQIITGFVFPGDATAKYMLYMLEEK